MSTIKYRQVFPRKFFDDHAERGLLSAASTINNEFNTLIDATLTLADLNELESDAQFYTDPAGPDECPPGLIASAQRTIAAIARARARGPETPGPRGGKREGAGRPNLGVTRVNVTLDSDTLETLRALGDGNVSEGIRRAAAML